MARSVARMVRRLSSFVIPRRSAKAKPSLTSEANWIQSFLQTHASNLRVPVVLISQAQRSGGTLLSQLFDSHSQIANYPIELQFGPEVPEDGWPTLELTKNNSRIFSCLDDDRLVRTFREGFSKSVHDPRRYAFFYSCTLHRELFLHSCNVAPPRSSRDFLDIYFSTFFHAWLNYRTNLRNVKWVTAFAPRLASNEKNVEAFFRDYPDGRLIQLLRAPHSWLSSAKRHKRTRRLDLSDDELMQIWSASTESVMRNRCIYGNSVVIISFETLVADTSLTMQHLCSVLGIDFEAVLLAPTFNGELCLLILALELKPPEYYRGLYRGI